MPCWRVRWTSPEQAKTLCKLMLDRGFACEVSTYRGTAF